MTFGIKHVGTRAELVEEMKERAAVHRKAAETDGLARYRREHLIGQAEGLMAAVYLIEHWTETEVEA